MSRLDPRQRRQYEALTRGAGRVDLPDRSVVRARGSDRLEFIHNFCTNEVRRLEAGGGCEAFFTTAQGKTLAFCGLFHDGDFLTIETVPGAAAGLIAHLDRYLISEDVVLEDDSRQVAVFALAGNEAADRLRAMGGEHVPEENYRSAAARLDGVPCLLRKVPWTPHCWLLEFALEQRESADALLQRHGLPACDAEVWETVRIERGWPRFGSDITPVNLPQEAARDRTAINFVKGCYLGQETVARLDALGHVNKILRSLKFSGAAVPPAGTLLQVAGKEAAHVTSAVFSPHFDAPLALAYVRRGHETPGSTIDDPRWGRVEVLPLPAVSEPGR